MKPVLFLFESTKTPEKPARGLTVPVAVALRALRALALNDPAAFALACLVLSGLKRSILHASLPKMR